MASEQNVVESLKEDLKELEVLESQTTRPRLKNMIFSERKKIEQEIEKLVKQSQKPKASGCTKVQVKLTNYAWDQEEEYVSFYVTLKDVKKLPSENIHLECTDKSIELLVKDLNGKDYVFTIKNLLKEIKPDKCTTKQKTDMVVINCPKVERGFKWTHVTEYEKKAAQSNKMDLEEDDKSDPGDGLMKIMKQMYDKGDDEMKRTIAKAWTESQQQKMKMNP